MKPLLIAFGLLMLASCSYEKKLSKWCARCPTHDSLIVERIDSTIITTDTVVSVIPPDSAWYYALIECVNNKPVIKQSETTNTKKTKVKVDLTDGKLSVMAHSLGDTILTLKNEITRLKIEQKTQSSVIVPPCPDCSLKWWQKSLMWLGVGALIYIIIFITWFIARQFPQVKGISIISKIISLLR